MTQAGLATATHASSSTEKSEGLELIHQRDKDLEAGVNTFFNSAGTRLFSPLLHTGTCTPPTDIYARTPHTLSDLFFWGWGVGG